MLSQVPTEWEVVDVYAVKPVRVYVEDDGATIVRLAPHEMMGSYTFDMAAPVAAHASGSTHKSTHARRPTAARSRTQSSDSTATTSTSTSTSSPAPPASPPAKLARLGSAFSFLRTHTPYGHRRPSTSSSSSLDTAVDNSGSGSSDGESDAAMTVPRKSLFGKRRNSDKASTRARSTSGLRTVETVAAAEEPAYRKVDLKRALKFARGELMKQVEASGKNALVLEGWSITVLRQDTRYRLRIEYTGRPAIVSYSEDQNEKIVSRVPPFLEVIDQH